jgi:hypothetical protein
MDYTARFADVELQTRLSSAGAVVIEGAKAVGKTATAQRQAVSVVFLDTDLNARTAAELDPSLVLQGATPRLIDVDCACNRDRQDRPVTIRRVRRVSTASQGGIGPGHCDEDLSTDTRAMTLVS